MTKVKANKKTLKSKSEIEIIASKENFLIDKEKRYQRTVPGPQVENQTTLKETKKKPLPKPVVKKKK